MMKTNCTRWMSLVAIALAALTAFCGERAMGATVAIVNHSFELEDTSKFTFWTDTFVGWQQLGGAVQDAGMAGGATVGADGDQYAYINAGFGFIYQDVTLTAEYLNPYGFQYTVALATRDPAFGDPGGDAVGGGSIELGFQFFDSAYNNKSNEIIAVVDRGSLNFSAFQDFTHTISVNDAFAELQAGDILRLFVRKGDVNGINIDNFRVAQAIPEPAATSLAALLGLAYAGCVRRRACRR